MNGLLAVLNEVPSLGGVARIWRALECCAREILLPVSGEMRSPGPVTEAASDQELIQASLRKGDNSFAKLVERYEALVASVLWHFTRDHLVLEELVQETFVEAYFSLHRFRSEAPLLPWLRTIATRIGYRHWRRVRRDRGRADLNREWQSRKLPADESAPSDTAEYVFAMLERLEPKDRLVLTLQYFEQCSVTEIATRMGWTATLVKVRSFRARRKLRAILEAEQER